MNDSVSPVSLAEVIKIFFRNPGDHYDALAELIDKFEYELLDDHEEAQTLIPPSEIPDPLVHICYTDFDNAPYLITTKATAPLAADPGKTLTIVTRRFAMMQTPEREIFELISDFTGIDPVKTDEDAGNHMWTWTIPPGLPVLHDGFRLYVAVNENMLILDRLTSVVR